MIDHSKTIEALTLELDKTKAQLREALSAPQAAGVDLDKNEVLARIDELTDDICSLTMPNRKVTAADMRKKIHGKCKELYEVAYLALMEKP